MSTAKPREFTKVDRALEMQVIDWLQWTEWEEELGKKHPAELALEMISLRKKAYAALEEELAQLKFDTHDYKDYEKENAKLKAELAENKSDMTAAYMLGNENMKDENRKLKAQVELYSEAIELIGHNGIDFGYGVFKCEPEKVAQDVSQKIKELG